MPILAVVCRCRRVETLAKRQFAVVIVVVHSGPVRETLAALMTNNGHTDAAVPAPDASALQ